MGMRILHTVRSLRPETGGLAAAVRALAVAQRRRGEVAVIVSLDPADAVEGGDGLVVLGRKSHGYGYAPDYVPWLRAHARDYDAVVVHGMWQYPGFGAWRALRGGGTPYVVFCHGMLDVWFKRAHPRKHAKKWLYWPWAEYRVLRDAAAVCFTAEEERRRARESFWLYRARERISPIGIEAPAGDAAQEREAFFAAYPALRGREFLLFLGRIHPKKGVDLLLRGYAAARAGGAAAELPALVIAGPGDDAAYRSELDALVAELGLEAAVVWLPMIAGAIKWGALRACAAFVLISHQENFGVAIVEALACGRPVLISDQIAIWREITTAGAGFAAPDTTAGAIDVLTRWRGLSGEARAAMGRAACACFERQFEIGEAAAALARLVGEVTGKSR